MRRALVIAFLALAANIAAFGAYAYDAFWPQACSGCYQENTADDNSWIAPALTGTYYGYPNGSVSQIYTQTVPGASANDYEISATMAWSAEYTNAMNGTYIEYVRATQNALSILGSCVGSFVSVELAVSSLSSASPAQLHVRQCTNGSLATLGGSTVMANSGSTLRSVVFGSTLWVFLDGNMVWSQTGLSLTSGNPGLGGYGMPNVPLDGTVGYVYGGFSAMRIGHHDTVAPSAPGNATTVQPMLLPGQVSLQWQGAQDDANGVGVYQYAISRGGTALATSAVGSFADNTASAGTTYTYSVTAVDFHGNVGPAASWTVTTPPANSVDPRRTGVRPTGSYWGGGGEQIDMASGNLNYTMPLLKALGRSGNALPVSLTYNSQNWRQDSGTNWQLGEDSGYGWGWKVQIGSLTPYYSAWSSGVDHYIFADGTGAQYRLGVNSGGVYSSQESIYVWFDSNTNRLHFKDGSFWYMGATSSGMEQDAGTLYPTVVEDFRGNQIIVNYKAAAQMPSGANNTSGRLATIEDVRAIAVDCGYYYSLGYDPGTCAITPTYSFTYSTVTYNSSGIPNLQHLTGITNAIGTVETYQFTYTSGALAPPFGTDANWSGVTASRLSSINVPAAGTYQFSYDTAGAAELTEVVLPWGGNLQWSYVTQAYAGTSGTRLLREVGTRYLSSQYNGSSEWTYPVTHSDSGTTISTVHADATLADASGNGAKTWTFQTSGSSAWQTGLATQFVQKTSATGTAMTQDTYTWSQDPAGNPYISAKLSTADPTTANVQTYTTQTLDQYGNLTQMAQYPFGNTTTPLRTYNSTYLNASTYSGGATYESNYLRGLLLSTTLTTGGTTSTLVQNYYDGGFGGRAAPSYSCSYQIGYSSPPGQELDYAQTTATTIRGWLYESVTPAKSTCVVYSLWTGASGTAASDGSSTSLGFSAATNYAAPTTITQQGYSESIGYNSWLGVTQTTGPNGEQMYMTYDTQGRPTSATSPYGDPSSPTYTYAYSTAGTLPVWQSKTGPDGFTRTTLDGLGRAIKVERGPSSASIQSVVDTVYAPCACSPLAKLSQTSQPHAPGTGDAWTTYTYDGIGRTVSVQQPDGASTTHYLYSGSQTTVIDPAGTTVTGPTGHWKTFTNDVLGNLITVTEPDPANPTTATLTTNYTYDWMNHLTGVSMPRGSITQTRSFVYDNAGRLTSATNPESGTVTYTYNSDNTLQYKQDARGQQTVYTYDSNKRVTETQVFPTGQTHSEDTCQRVTYSYDTNPYDNGAYSQYTAGRLAAAQYTHCDNYSILDPNWDPSLDIYDSYYTTTFTEMYSYHPAGAVTGKSFGVARFMNGGTAPGSLNVAYSYDSAGRLTSTTIPGSNVGGTSNGPTNAVYNQTYDSMSRPNGLTDTEIVTGWSGNLTTSETWVQNVQYDFAGRLTSLQYQTAYGWDTDLGTPWSAYTTESMTYNVNGQLASVGWATPATGYTSAGLGGTITYGYSTTQNNGQITQVSDSVSGETVVYQYDALKRVISAASTPNAGSTPTAWTQTYGYDGFGNLTSKVLNGGTNTAPALNSTGNNQLATSYDASGNMLSGLGATLTYDGANRVTSATETSGGTEYYGYAPDNKRIYRRNGSTGVEEWTLWGARGEKLGTYSGAAWVGGGGGGLTFTQTKRYIWFAGKMIWEGAPVPVGPSGQPPYIVNGVAIYSTMFTVTGGAAYRDRLGSNRASGSRYYPYGEEIGTQTANDREKFATYNRDSFTGLDYADQRYYASSYGRFNTADPGRSAFPSNPGSWNRYAYVGGDPVNRNDRHGLCWVDTTNNQYYDTYQDWSEATYQGTAISSDTIYETNDGCSADEGADGGGDDGSAGANVSPWMYLGNDSGGKPASPMDRSRDLIWMNQDLNALKTFTTPDKSPCATDLSLFGLTSTGVQNIANSIHLTNLADLSPGLQSTFLPGADFTAKQNQATGGNFLIYNQNEFWQSTSNQMLGTLLHEIIHFNNFSLSDSQIASKLGVSITPQDDTAISLKLTTDCFPGQGR